MLASERHRIILAELNRHGSVETTELAELLGVSSMTIRRDLTDLSELGELEKVHGGAITSRAAQEPRFEDKQGLRRTEKQRIAAEAVGLVRPGMTIAFSAGSTCVAVAAACRELPRITYVTNSVPVSDVVYQGAQPPTVLLTGGSRTLSGAMVGPLANASLAPLAVDLLFIGVHGVHPTRGLSTPNLAEAETNKALINAARQVVAVFDSSKWNANGLSQFANWDIIDTIVTDKDTPSAALEALSDRNVKIIQA